MRLAASFFMLLSLAQLAWGQNLDQANELYARRAEAIDNALFAANIYGTQAGQATDPKDQGELFIKRSLSLYYYAEHLPKEEGKKKEEFHNKGIAAAQAAARALKNVDDTLYARALFWEGANKGKAALANGDFTAFMGWGKLRDKMRYIIGKLKMPEVESWGPNRILGRGEFKVPTGSTQRSIAYLKEAYENAPEHGLNHLFYVEVLRSNGQKELAQKILEEFVAMDPQTLNPNRIPETLEEQEKARGCLDKGECEF